MTTEDKIHVHVCGDYHDGRILVDLHRWGPSGSGPYPEWEDSDIYDTKAKKWQKHDWDVKHADVMRAYEIYKKTARYVPDYPRI